MYYFCTYFDRHYLARGLALYQSLRGHCPSFRLWVLCMDRESHSALSRLGLSDVCLIALEDFEKGDEELLRAKENRSRVEYYFTCTPSLPLFIFKSYPEVDMITYLDADLFFFADPLALYKEIADHSIAIIEHRFPSYLLGNRKYGIYNVGWVSFRRDERAFSCLRWWREQCIEWCYDRLEEGRFADQKYLDDWPDRFPGVAVLRHKGANLAPWNLANYTIETDGERVLVDGQPLLFFHYHGFKQLRNWLYDPNLAAYKVRPSKAVLRSVFAPYIAVLMKTAKQVSPFLGEVSSRNGIRGQMAGSPSPQQVPKPCGPVRLMKRVIHAARFVLTQSYIVAFNGRII